MGKNTNSYGFKLARNITKKTAKTFYFASHLLPKNKRLAAYAIYSVCRLSDDAVDAQKTAESNDLADIKINIEKAFLPEEINDPLLKAFKETMERHNIPKEYFGQLLEGIRMDTYQSRYSDFSQLYEYCYKVAGVVGLIMLKVFGYNRQEAEKYAVELGVAMQLTNILRDIKEDFGRGRIYLPQEEMKKFGVEEGHIAKEIIDKNFIDLLKFQINRARNYYRSSAKGIPMITDRACRFVTSSMKEMYSGILNSIEGNNYNVFSQRAGLDNFQKLITLLKTFFQGKYR